MKMPKKRNIRRIANKTVVVQSCWLDDDLDFVANIKVITDDDLDHRQLVLIAGQTVTYPHFSPYYNRIGKKMTHDEFDMFLNDNLQPVLDLITNLLEPNELARLKTT